MQLLASAAAPAVSELLLTYASGGAASLDAHRYTVAVSFLAEAGGSLTQPPSPSQFCQVAPVLKEHSSEFTVRSSNICRKLQKLRRPFGITARDDNGGRMMVRSSCCG
jgi:hypothetical protein